MTWSDAWWLRFSYHIRSTVKNKHNDFSSIVEIIRGTKQQCTCIWYQFNLKVNQSSTLDLWYENLPLNTSVPNLISNPEIFDYLNIKKNKLQV